MNTVHSSVGSFRGNNFTVFFIMYMKGLAHISHSYCPTSLKVLLVPAICYRIQIPNCRETQFCVVPLYITSKCDDVSGTVLANDPHTLSHVQCLPYETQPSIWIGGKLYVNTVTERSSVACILEFLLMCPTTKKTWIPLFCN
jgi:hypothetical protein